MKEFGITEAILKIEEIPYISILMNINFLLLPFCEWD